MQKRAIPHRSLSPLIGARWILNIHWSTPRTLPLTTYASRPRICTTPVGPVSSPSGHPILPLGNGGARPGEAAARSHPVQLPPPAHHRLAREAGTAATRVACGMGRAVSCSSDSAVLAVADTEARPATLCASNGTTYTFQLNAAQHVIVRAHVRRS
jgi:hypothetical protein